MSGCIGSVGGLREYANLSLPGSQLMGAPTSPVKMDPTNARGALAGMDPTNARPSIELLLQLMQRFAGNKGTAELAKLLLAEKARELKEKGATEDQTRALVDQQAQAKLLQMMRLLSQLLQTQHELSRHTISKIR